MSLSLANLIKCSLRSVCTSKLYLRLCWREVGSRMYPTKKRMKGFSWQRTLIPAQFTTTTNIPISKPYFCFKAKFLSDSHVSIPKPHLHLWQGWELDSTDSRVVCVNHHLPTKGQQGGFDLVCWLAILVTCHFESLLSSFQSTQQARGAVVRVPAPLSTYQRSVWLTTTSNRHKLEEQIQTSSSVAAIRCTNVMLPKIH